MQSHTQPTLADISLHSVITTHAEICSPSYVADGRCPRAVASTLGDLYTKDLCFSVGAGSMLSFLRATPLAQRAKQWLVRTLFRRPDYEARTCGSAHHGARACGGAATGLGILLPRPPIAGVHGDGSE